MTIATFARQSIAGGGRQTARTASPRVRIEAWLRDACDQIRAMLPVVQTPRPAYVLVRVARRAPVAYRRETLGSPRRC